MSALIRRTQHFVTHTHTCLITNKHVSDRASHACVRPNADVLLLLSSLTTPTRIVHIPPMDLFKAYLDAEEVENDAMHMISRHKKNVFLADDNMLV